MPTFTFDFIKLVVMILCNQSIGSKSSLGAPHSGHTQSDGTSSKAVLLKHKKMMYERKDSMEKMGAAYMANGIVTLAGSRLYTSLSDTPEVIDEALNRFEEVFKHVKKTNKGLI